MPERRYRDVSVTNQASHAPNHVTSFEVQSVQVGLSSNEYQAASIPELHANKTIKGWNTPVYTIGNSHGLSRLRLIEELHKLGVRTLADIRGNPRAGRQDDLHKSKELSKCLAAASISYVFWGAQLGEDTVQRFAEPDLKLILKGLFASVLQPACLFGHLSEPLKCHRLKICSVLHQCLLTEVWHLFWKDKRIAKKTHVEIRKAADDKRDFFVTHFNRHVKEKYPNGGMHASVLPSVSWEEITPSLLDDGNAYRLELPFSTEILWFPEWLQQVEADNLLQTLQGVNLEYPTYTFEQAVGSAKKVQSKRGVARFCDEFQQRHQQVSKGCDFEAQRFQPWTQALLSEVERASGTVFNCIWVNEYSGGDVGITWHTDLGHLGLGRNPTIASISVGATRSFLMKSQKPDPKHGACRISFPLRHGSLLVMGSNSQTHWLHSVPPEDVNGLRFNLTFRFYALEEDLISDEKTNSGRDVSCEDAVRLLDRHGSRWKRAARHQPTNLQSTTPLAMTQNRPQTSPHSTAAKASTAQKRSGTSDDPAHNAVSTSSASHKPRQDCRQSGNLASHVFSSSEDEVRAGEEAVEVTKTVPGQNANRMSFGATRVVERWGRFSCRHGGDYSISERNTSTAIDACQANVAQCNHLTQKRQERAIVSLSNEKLNGERLIAPLSRPETLQMKNLCVRISCRDEQQKDCIPETWGTKDVVTTIDVKQSHLGEYAASASEAKGRSFYSTTLKGCARSYYPRARKNVYQKNVDNCAVATCAEGQMSSDSENGISIGAAGDSNGGDTGESETEPECSKDVNTTLLSSGGMGYDGVKDMKGDGKQDVRYCVNAEQRKKHGIHVTVNAVDVNAPVTFESGSAGTGGAEADNGNLTSFMLENHSIADIEGGLLGAGFAHCGGDVYVATSTGVIVMMPALNELSIYVDALEPSKVGDFIAGLRGRVATAGTSKGFGSTLLDWVRSFAKVSCSDQTLDHQPCALSDSDPNGCGELPFDPTYLPSASDLGVDPQRQIKISTWGRSDLRNPPPSQREFFVSIKKLRYRLEPKRYNGLDALVQSRVGRCAFFQTWVAEAVQEIEANNLHSISISCWKGCHRSVASAEIIRKAYYPNAVIHHLSLRDLRR